ncbi:uncharacterized protein LOC104584794 isoform X2 [Brachypodium distachyon]|uniref:VWFA domain-containing protein n=1 Tax=Brachypodium distachyon TaxID=15368 RepID=A0A0Q3HVQ5_BRADI|nr:uncharacterized protein LOC104584794 isoform X2 [Brachypodium distachyon]KQJ92347.1 hypothetical protein BRADI_4g43061v3 [Brachypodium distachyon]|eukprot:XP_014758852.1 uncharacterized protein LOC104584794 isoform X2 [Brachypodium distachyon]
MDKLVQFLHQDLKDIVMWLYVENRKYLMKPEDNIELLTKSSNLLLATMDDVRMLLRKALKNKSKWSPKSAVKEWLSTGRDDILLVHDTLRELERYRAAAGARFILHRPCADVVSRYNVNASAIWRKEQVCKANEDGQEYAKNGMKGVAEDDDDDDDGGGWGDSLMKVLDDVEKLQRFEVLRRFKPEPKPQARSSQARRSQARRSQERSSIDHTGTEIPARSSQARSSQERSLIDHTGTEIPLHFLQARSSQARRSQERSLIDHTGTETPARSSIDHTGTEIPGIETLQLSALSKFRALPRSDSDDSFPVMMRVKAPCFAYRSRAPIDLVLVLDVGSRAGDERLEQMKQGALFVAHNLEDDDRLSVVAVAADNSTRALFPLSSLSDDEHRATAKAKILELTPAELADIEDEGTTDLESVLGGIYSESDRRSRLRGIMLLSEGIASTPAPGGGGGLYRYGAPVYTFSVGSQHDPCKLYHLATQEGGTYSAAAATDLKSITHAMALCVGGLTSIAAQDMRIDISALGPGVRISRISCGSCRHYIDEDDSSSSGWIDVPDMSSSEEKNFLVYVHVPAEAGAAGFFPVTTKLLSVKASYYRAATMSRVSLDPVEVSIERPRGGQSQASSAVDAQVAAELLRTTLVDKVAEMQQQMMQSTGPAADISIELTKLRDSLLKDIPEAKETKDTWDGLSRDLDTMVHAGLPYMLSWLSSHQWQRAAMLGSMSSTVSIDFNTTWMQDMVDSVHI